MSNRERWIIYPLLFMTLGMTIRGRILPPIARTPGVKVERVDALDVQCRSLTITNADGEKRLRIGVTPSDVGQLEIYKGSSEKVALIGADQAGQSGLVEVFSQNGQLAAFVGFREDGPGLFVDDAESGLRLRMTSSVVDWLELIRKPLESSKDHESP